jgi:hypothetical protein
LISYGVLYCGFGPTKPTSPAYGEFVTWDPRPGFTREDIAAKLIKDAVAMGSIHPDADVPTITAKILEAATGVDLHTPRPGGLHWFWLRVGKPSTSLDNTIRSITKKRAE